MNTKLPGNVLLGIIILVIASSCASRPKGLTAAAPFDINKYTGKWYEIARTDTWFERGLNNTTAEYSIRDDGKIRVVNRGFNYEEQEWEQAVGKAKFAADNHVGRLKVSFFGPFYSTYNVVEIDCKYKYALVAGKNHKYLWILARKTTIPDKVRQKYLKIAEDLGYDTSELIWVEHNKK